MFIIFTAHHNTINSIQNNATPLVVHGTNDMRIICQVSGQESCVVMLKDVQYYSDACDNLVLQLHMDKKGLHITSLNGHMVI